ncbi:MAG: hypothetical protein ABJN14_11635 [Paracoccaceae bacterium]
MQIKLTTPVLALIVALSTVSFTTAPTQATAQTAYVVGQTYKTKSGHYVKFIGHDRFGKPKFTQVSRRKKVHSSFHFSNRSHKFSRHDSFSRRSHFGGHRSIHRGHRRHFSHGGHRRLHKRH